MQKPHPRSDAGVPALLRPFQRFFATESAGGILLLAAAVVAMVWANTPYAGSYFAIWQTHVVVGAGDFALAKPLLLWINDGLMAIFFLVVGLEIKREFLDGELASAKKAAFSVAAAVGGMVAPALIYAAFNRGGPGAAGWGIPMATDIAFALGVLALLGPRVPQALKVFLTAVAVVDDLGAVLVIAVFYTAKVSGFSLAVAGASLAALLVMNRAGVRRLAPYILLGLVLWVAVLKSGVHATVAGVLLALTIPSRQGIDALDFLGRARRLIQEFATEQRPGVSKPSPAQVDALRELKRAAHDADTPLVRLELALHPWVAFAIMPIFALANAGVAVGGDLAGALTDTITLGIVAGLCAGKQVGIVTAAWLAARLGVASLPDGVTWRQIWGVSVLCGIGFTMSLFIGGLALDAPEALDRAKLGILLASALSGVAGGLVLLVIHRAPRPAV